MPPQVSKEMFAQALSEMGHDPDSYRGRKLSITSVCENFELDRETVLEAIEREHIMAHYDYRNDTIWIDALDAAHFYFCVQNEAHLYSA